MTEVPHGLRHENGTTIAAQETDSIAHVRKLARMVTRAADAHMRAHGITAAQYELLRVLLHATHDVTAIMIVRELAIEKSTLSRNIKRLIAAEFITMDPPKGRHGKILRATEKARQCMPHAAQAYRNAERDIATWLPRDVVMRIRSITNITS